MTIDTLAIIGMGLIGGSIARAARKRGIAGRIVGVESNLAHRPTAQSIADLVVSELLHPDVLAADVVVVCTPVDQIAEQVVALAGLCKPGALLTDVGSTKAVIVAGIERSVPTNTLFIGGHPLAGSEKQGPQYASADLFVGRLCVITPTENTQPDAVVRVTDFWQSLGASVRAMPPEEHDRAVALTSHLPHLVASALAGTLPPELDALTATGFRDTTRLAASQPELWAAIFEQNAPAIREAMQQMQARLEAFRQALADVDRDRLLELLSEGKRVKDRLANGCFDSGKKI